MDSRASRVSTGLHGPSIEVDCKSTISDLEHIKDSSKEEFSFQRTSIKAENKAPKNLQSRSRSTALPLEHISIKTEYKAQNNLQSRPRSTAPPIEYGSIPTEDKAQNAPQSRPCIQIENYRMAKEAAELLTTRLNKPTQTRRPWSDREIETLLKLIERYGTSWTDLKDKDVEDVLELKDQTALRDKARNMKMDYLKAGPFLPAHFENIALTKTQVDKLAELGITYNRGTGLLSGTKEIKKE